jgi:branched-chain amino acid transport system permease protein
MNRGVKGRLVGFVLLVLLLLALPLSVRNEYHLHILTMVFMNILIAVSFRMTMTTGLVPFSQAAFVAIGGYASALAVMRLGLSSWLGLIFAILVSMAIAIVFGLILLRLRGTYFFMATTAFGEIVLLIFTRFTNPFGGAAGLVNIPVPNPIIIPGLFSVVFGSKISFYYLALMITLVLILIAYRLDRGRLGSIWTGLQQAEQLAQSVGINVMLYKIIAFSVGSSIGAAAGAFQAHYFSHINPSGFGFFQLCNYLIFVMIGGRKKFAGPVIGAFLLTMLAEFLSLYESLALYQTIVFGLVLILVVIFLPDGLISLPEKVSLSSWRFKGKEKSP